MANTHDDYSVVDANTPAAAGTYTGFLSLMKWGTVFVILVTALVIMLIS